MEMGMIWLRISRGENAKVLTSLALLGMGVLLGRLYASLVGWPKKLRGLMAQQGIRGPPQSWGLGNVAEIKKARAQTPVAVRAGESPAEHKCAEILFPFFEQWRRQYGMEISLSISGFFFLFFLYVLHYHY